MQQNYRHAQVRSSDKHTGAEIRTKLALWKPRGREQRQATAGRRQQREHARTAFGRAGAATNIGGAVTATGEAAAKRESERRKPRVVRATSDVGAATTTDACAP